MQPTTDTQEPVLSEPVTQVDYQDYFLHVPTQVAQGDDDSDSSD